MLYIDLKYIGLISNRLERLKRKTNNIFNCRCPLCGDSRSDRTKTRGYLFEKKGNMLYFCHNCGASMSFANFLKSIDGELYKEYAQETFIEKYSSNTTVQPVDITNPSPPKFMKDSPLKQLKKISQLPYNHPAKLYVEKRKIPPASHYKLFYAPKFKTWVNTFIPDKFAVEIDEPRLILPFLDKEKNCFGFQGRAFAASALRYITIMLDSDKPKIFGLDSLDITRPFYITEGPIDSLFLPNAIAMAGADASIDWIDPSYRKNSVYVYDNEPRNSQITSRMEKVIDKGYKVVVWPSETKEKDINDMVLTGKPLPALKDIIDSNTFEGLSAKLAFTTWKKI